MKIIPQSSGRRPTLATLSLALVVAAVTVIAQNGTPDASFVTGAGPNALVNAVTVQPDGRILIGGNFTTVNGVARSRVARLNPNGSEDAGFTPGSGANDDIRAIAVQLDGKIVVGGDFTTFFGAPRQKLARLHPNGWVDYTFNLPGGASASAQVHDLAIQSDGRIVIVGSFTAIAGASANRIARLNPDGSVNNSFDPGTGANNLIRTVALQVDGKIVIGGDFTAYNGQARNRIARLNADGSLDTGFNPGTGFNSSVYDVLVDEAGRILGGGEFTAYNGKTQRGLVRLTTTGEHDPMFDMTIGFNGGVRALALQPNGQLIAGGAFTTVNQVGRVRVARLNPDGSVDLTFDPGTGPNGTVLSVAAPLDGNVLIAGQFTSVAGQATRKYATRLLANGGTTAAGSVQIVVMPAEQKVHEGYAASFTVVAAGNPPLNYQWKFNGASLPTGTNGTLHLTSVTPAQAGEYVVTVSNPAGSVDSLPAALIVLPSAPPSGSLDLAFNTAQGPNNQVYAVALQPDGRVLIGGIFTTVDGQPRSRLARLRSNGSVDPTFAPLTGTSGEVRTVVLQEDGKILIGGDFLTYNGAPRQRIARVLEDSTLDGTFLPGLAANDTVDEIAVQPDGRILLGGLFTTYAGETRNRIARLNADGTLDASFNPPGGANGRVRTVMVQANGKILIGGEFTTVAGVGRNRIARLNADGGLDESFEVGSGFNAAVYRLIPFQGGALAAGDFTTYSGAAARCLASITITGGLAGGFDTSAGLNDYAYDADVDPDGNLVAAGAFTVANNLTRNRVARLFSGDGSVDTGFDPGSGPNLFVYGVAAQTDGKVIIGGAFTTVAGQPRRYIARLNSAPRNEPPPPRLTIRNTDDGVRVDLYAERGFEYTVQRSSDLIQWQNWTTVAGAGLEAEVRLIDSASQTQPAGFYRVVFP